MKGYRINPAWQNAIYEEQYIGSDGKVMLHRDGTPLFPYPKRGNRIENGQIVDPISHWIQVDDLPDLSKLTPEELEKRNTITPK